MELLINHQGGSLREAYAGPPDSSPMVIGGPSKQGAAERRLSEADDWFPKRSHPDDALPRTTFLKLAFILISIVMFGCGEITTSKNTAAKPAGSASPSTSENVTSDPNHPTGNTAVVLGANFTDPIGTLSLLTINAPRIVTKNLQLTHSDALVRSFNNKLYVVNRLGGDNIEVVDPADDFSVTRQFSVGLGTNPQDIVVISETKAYMTLLQPEDNRSSSLDVDDLLVINPSLGTIDETIDLTEVTALDGDRHARAALMLLVGNHLFIAIQDLSSDLSLPPNQPGRIAVVNTDTNKIIATIVLEGRNPVAMDYEPETGMIYVANADHFNLESSFGGIEVIDTEELKTLGLQIPDEELGGAPGDIEIHEGIGCITVGYFNESEQTYKTKVVTFEGTTLYQSEGYIQNVAFDENGILLVGDRDPSINGILFIDPGTGDIVGGPINTGPAPSSITFIEQ